MKEYRSTMLMGKFIKMSGLVIILGSIAAGAYFGGARKYAEKYNEIIKLLDEAFVLAKKGDDAAIQKTKTAALESQKFLGSPLTKLMNDKHSEALLKARLTILLSRSYYEMGRDSEDDSLTEQALQLVDSVDIRNRSALSEMEFFQKEFMRKINQYSARSAYARAPGYVQKLISIVEKKINRQYPEGQALQKSLPYLYSFLGKLYANQQKWIEAKTEYEKALSSAEGILSVEEPFYALSYWYLGLIYLQLKQYAESENMMKHALESMTSSNRPQNAIVSEIYHNLAGIYKAQGKADLAKQFFNKSLEWHEKVFGAKSLSLLHVLADYAAHLRSIGDTEKAMLLENRAKLIKTESARGVASPR